MKFDDLTNKIIGAALEVHKTLGPGFLENLYEKALVIEFRKRGIPFEQQKSIDIYYSGQYLGTHMIDLMVDNDVVVELKACRALEKIHYAQVISYLKATNLQTGLLLNFGTTMLEIKRLKN